ncbi:hypothetical protein EDB87DRAFT_1827350 [Lactarius vividus]|nr:hypothetical protein EDB87DRAFT_1827350 [Lactarius vividus]
MNVQLQRAPESGRCEACGRFFICEASLTKHLCNNCTIAHNRSRDLWKNGPTNIKRLNASLMYSRKQVHKEDGPQASVDNRPHAEQSVSPSMNTPDFELDVEIGDTVSVSMGPLPYRRVRRPMWKVLESAPVEPPSSSAASNNGRSSPVDGDDRHKSPIEDFPHFTTMPANQFGLVQKYQQPMAITASEDRWRPPTVDSSPTCPTSDREVSDIIYPYPNISSFLFNLTWRWMQGVVSSSNRASMAKVLLDQRFESKQLDGVDFTAIENKIAMDIQSPWGGNGWRRNTIIIEVPTGKKPTAASHRMEANARACSR